MNEWIDDGQMNENIWKQWMNEFVVKKNVGKWMQVKGTTDETNEQLLTAIIFKN